MSRQPRTLFRCRDCGAEQPKWAGQCATCGAWNTLEEARPAAAAAAGGARRSATAASRPTRLADVDTATDTRTTTGIDELDRVLGGGLVAGSVTLLGGDPGIGKSTLLLQCLARLTERIPALYVTGEESVGQVGLRARRLGVGDADLAILAETVVEAMLDAADSARSGVLVVDSIQTLSTEAVQSAPGGVAQVRESAARLVRWAKETGTALFLVGHVTKEGTLAGPRVLEHMVDTVLYFEGDAGSRWRMIRAVKNRFGAVNELGVFAMDDTGLKPVKNPSALFLSRHAEPVPGSAILVTREGTRPLLVEVQALVDTSALGNPRRVALGLEQNRLAMLLAVLHRHAGIAMFDQDVYANVVGGVRVSETAADLAVLVAALSSFRNRPTPTDLAVFGEVGLAGEIRPVPNGEERVREAAKHGFTRIILPQANQPREAPAGVELFPVGRLGEALDALADL